MLEGKVDIPFNGNPKTVVDLVELKLREKHKDGVLGYEVFGLRANSDNGERRVTFTYRLFLRESDSCYVEIDGEKILIDI